MAHLVLIRHGEPDYSGVTERGYIGHGRDLAPLTPAGIAQAEAVADDPRLKGAAFIVSSPYTRALQTAAIISRKIGLPIKVELGLHEWMPDTTHQYKDGATYSPASLEECTLHKGVRSPDCVYNWESLLDVAKRSFSALSPYVKQEKILVVCHGVVMRQFVFQDRIPYCGILETDFDENFQWKGFEDSNYRGFVQNKK